MSSLSLSGLGMTLQKPTELKEPDMNDSGYSLTKLDNQHWIFNEIAIDFENAGLNIVKIEQLKNRLQWQKYTNERKNIQARQPKDPDFQLNEKYLYHGTNASRERLCQEGLDFRLAKKGCFGRGMYFSDYPQKCIKYAEKNKSESVILLVRVILGDSKKYPDGKRDSKLAREPEKACPFIGWRFHDSVTGRPKDHNEYVVYRNDKALIECIITYSKAEESKSSVASNSRDTLNSFHPVKSVPLQQVPPPTKSLSTLDSFHMNSLKPRFPVASKDDDNQSVTTDEEDNSGSSVSDEKEGYSSDSSTDLKDDEAVVRKSNKKPVMVSKPVIKRNAGEDILALKRKEFARLTGERNPIVIESYLSIAELNVNKAAQLFMDKDKKRKELERRVKQIEIDKLEDDSEEEFVDASSPIDPVSDPEGWEKLSENDKTAIIEAQIDNFFIVIGLDDTDDNRRLCLKILASCDYNLDHSIVAYYESQ